MRLQTVQKLDGVDVHVWLTESELTGKGWVATMMSFFDKANPKVLLRWNRVYIHSPKELEPIDETAKVNNK